MNSSSDRLNYATTRAGVWTTADTQQRFGRCALCREMKHGNDACYVIEFDGEIYGLPVGFLCYDCVNNLYYFLVFAEREIERRREFLGDEMPL